MRSAGLGLIVLGAMCLMLGMSFPDSRWLLWVGLANLVFGVFTVFRFNMWD